MLKDELIAAINKGDREQVEVLLSAEKLPPEFRDFESVLNVAIQTGKTGCVELLLTYWIERYPIAWREQIIKGLESVAERGDVQMLATILDSDTFEPESWASLFEASVRGGSVEAMSYIESLAHNDPHSGSVYEFTSLNEMLRAAIKCKNSGAIRYLLLNALNQKTWEELPKVRSKKPSYAKLELSGAPNSPLELAIHLRSLKAVKALVRFEDTTKSELTNALQKVTHLNLAKYLIRFGADHSVVDDQNRNLLHLSVFLKNNEMALFYLELGQSPVARDKGGSCALLAAYHSRDFRLMQQFKAKGFRLNDSQRRRFIERAQSASDNEMTEFLLRQG